MNNMKLTKEQEIMNILFRDVLIPYNSRNMSKVIGISHVGAFKIFKKLEREEIAKPFRIGKAIIYSLNFENPLTSKLIETILIIESQNTKRWVEEFKELKDITDFVILFGSILKDEKSARDIDLLVVADKSNYNKIKKFISERDKLSNKKIHLIFQTHDDFKNDISKRNKVSLEIIKKGIVLFGQSNFVEVLKQ